jgi:predicted TIM-barrel fold metal-dependent hydrolase
MRQDLNRIDVHHHAITDTLRRALDDRGLNAGGWALPDWSPEGSLAVMESQGVARALFSVSSPGVHFGDDSEARGLARAINDELAEVAGQSEGRLGFFAVLPLPDVEGALDEAVRALDELGADGIGLLANSSGQYICEPAVRPLLDELDRRQATIFVHPNELPGGVLPWLPAPVADFTLDTTRAAFGLVRAGTMHELTNLRIILSHAGGLVAFLAERFVQMITTGVDPTADARELMEDIQRFYLDTALSTSPVSWPAVTSFARPGHVVFGSDSPFASDSMSNWFTDHLDALTADDEAQAREIAYENAGAILALRPSRGGPVAHV